MSRTPEPKVCGIGACDDPAMDSSPFCVDCYIAIYARPPVLYRCAYGHGCPNTVLNDGECCIYHFGVL